MHTNKHLKKELEMLIVGGKPICKRRISDIFEESTLRLIFVEEEDILKENRIKRYDLYCRPQEMEVHGEIVDFMTIVY